MEKALTAVVHCAEACIQTASLDTLCIISRVSGVYCSSSLQVSCMNQSGCR